MRLNDPAATTKQLLRCAAWAPAQIYDPSDHFTPARCPYGRKSSSTKTTTMTTPAKLFGRELSNYDEVDVDELLSKLSQEELTMLAKEVDPDITLIL
ncbi:hypothetical protein MSG28_001581 [Choristoneura fumiferana]|uniref:Uncharacterized protein n=1 Tax=Choristoneura fumiferana TaxID=7141 RepID=A0ACC0KVI1_CHOFU|nr:hypothetical protein MSG28_001581 [Choristoneura fumiferana]